MTHSPFPSLPRAKRSYDTLAQKKQRRKDAMTWLKKHPQSTQMPLSDAQLAELFSDPNAFGNASIPLNASGNLRKRKGRGLLPPFEQWTMRELAEAVRKEFEKRA